MEKESSTLDTSVYFQILDNFFDVFNNNADILCQLLDNEIANNKSKAVEVEILSTLKRCTLDIICGYLFFLLFLELFIRSLKKKYDAHLFHCF